MLRTNDPPESLRDELMDTVSELFYTYIGYQCFVFLFLGAFVWMGIVFGSIKMTANGFLSMNH